MFRSVAATLLASALVATVSVVSAERSGSAEPPGCRLTLSIAPMAFCETFDEPQGNPATRSGDLDPTLWGVSRTGGDTNLGQGAYNVWAPAVLSGCGAPVTVEPPNDVRICNGQVVEAVQDNGKQTTLALYPKQPFDIAGRTGTVSFDVSADSDGPHAAWPEFWWTDLPVPAPHGHLSEQGPYGANSFGFSLAGQCPGNVNYQFGGTYDYVGVDQMMITRDSRYSNLSFTKVGCVRKGSLTSLNHFELRINSSRAEVWGTDPASPILRLLAFAIVAMPLTRGVIWMEDVHYNACKFDHQCNHTFAWDNVTFDGPAPYRDLTFDVPDALGRVPNGVALGYPTPVTVVAKGVTWQQTPTKQFIGFNWYPYDASVPDVRVNGGPWHSTLWPFDDETYLWRTIAVPVDLSELHPGDNTIEFRGNTAVANVNVILIAAGVVPNAPPTTTTTTTTTTTAPTTTSTMSTTTTIPTSTIPTSTTTTDALTTTEVPSTTSSPTTTAPAPPTTTPTSVEWSTSVTVSPTSPTRGTTVTITASVTSPSSQDALVDIEVYDPYGRKVGQTYFDDEALTGGQAREFTLLWDVPANAARGRYVITVGVFAPGWSGLWNWNGAAGSFWIWPALPWMN